MKQNHAINFTRSVLILLVIVVHIVHFGTLYPEVKEGILSFMMPAFLVVTGYLVNVEKAAKDFMRYLWRIVVPYIIMVVGYSVLSYFLPVRDGISELSVTAVAEKLFVTSIGPYWFLYVMIGCGIPYYVAFRMLPLGEGRTTLRLLAFAAILYTLSLLLPLMAVKTVMYYFAGVAIRQYKLAYEKAVCPYVLSSVVFFGIIFFSGQKDWGSLLIVVAVYAFLSFSVWVSNKIETIGDKPFVTKLRSATQWIGMNTLPIYLFHPVFTMMGKYYLPFFAWDSTGLVYTAVTVALCLVGSIILALAMDKLQLSWIFAREKFFRSN